MKQAVRMGRRVAAMVVEVQDYAVKRVHCQLAAASAANPPTVITRQRLVRIVPELRQLTRAGLVIRAIHNQVIAVLKRKLLVHH